MPLCSVCYQYYMHLIYLTKCTTVLLVWFCENLHIDTTFSKRNLEKQCCLFNQILFEFHVLDMSNFPCYTSDINILLNLYEIFFKPTKNDLFPPTRYMHWKVFTSAFCCTLVLRFREWAMCTLVQSICYNIYVFSTQFVLCTIIN